MDILLWPADALKKKCLPVDFETDTEFRAQLQEMRQVMTKAGGIGLAANQVGILKRMLVAFKPGPGPQYFVNPKIIQRTGTRELMREGCLSLPGIIVLNARSTSIIVEHQDMETGSAIVAEYDGKLAHILQHEIDHLDGRTMIDNLPGGRKDEIRLHMRKLRQGLRK